MHSGAVDLDAKQDGSRRICCCGSADDCAADLGIASGFEEPIAPVMGGEGFFLGNSGDSCTETCAAQSLTVSMDGTNLVDSEETFFTALTMLGVPTSGPDAQCTGPTVDKGEGVVAPQVNTGNGNCRWNDPAGLDDPDAGQVASRRICCCVAPDAASQTEACAAHLEKAAAAPASTVPTTTTTVTDDGRAWERCTPEGAAQGKDLLLVEQRKTWAEAKAYCEAIGAQLYSPGDRLESLVVSRAVRRAWDSWVSWISIRVPANGPFDAERFADVYTGETVSEIVANPYRYFKWGPLWPKVSNTHRCAAVSQYLGFNNHACSYRTAFACERPANPALPVREVRKRGGGG